MTLFSTRTAAAVTRTTVVTSASPATMKTRWSAARWTAPTATVVLLFLATSAAAALGSPPGPAPSAVLKRTRRFSPAAAAAPSPVYRPPEDREGGVGAAGPRSQATPVLDEGGLLAGLLDSPETVKSILKALTRQKMDENRRNWERIAGEEAAVPPAPAAPVKPPRPPGLFGIEPPKGPGSGSASSGSASSGSPGRGPPGPKVGQDPSKLLLGLSQLFLSRSAPKNVLGKVPTTTTTTSKPTSKTTTTTTSPPVRPPEEFLKRLRNPQLLGQGTSLEKFGPSDLVEAPHRYRLPMQEHGPARLRYMSAGDFPNVSKYGLVPIPRRRRRRR